MRYGISYFKPGAILPCSQGIVEVLDIVYSGWKVELQRARTIHVLQCTVVLVLSPGHIFI